MVTFFVENFHVSQSAAYHKYDYNTAIFFQTSLSSSAFCFPSDGRHKINLMHMPNILNEKSAVLNLFTSSANRETVQLV